MQKHLAAAFAKHNQVLIKVLANTRDDKITLREWCFRGPQVLNASQPLCVAKNTHTYNVDYGTWDLLKERASTHLGCSNEGGGFCRGGARLPEGKALVFPKR